jgi:fibro-slime domain-containing protein
MKAFVRSLIPPMAVAAMALMPSLAHAGSIMMSATYFTISSSDPDMGVQPGGAYNDEVLSALGLDNLPMLNPGFIGPTDLSVGGTDGAMESGELTWWSPSLNSNVTQTSTGMVSLPFTCPSNYNVSMEPACYPPNGAGTNDGSTQGYQAILLSSVLDILSPQSISFTYSADDVAFIYIDGTNVCQLGGVHNVTAGTCISSSFYLPTGDHTLEIFYADTNQSNAALTLSATLEADPTPEPGSFGLAFMALVVLVVMRRRAVRVN